MKDKNADGKFFLYGNQELKLILSLKQTNTQRKTSSKLTGPKKTGK